MPKIKDENRLIRELKLYVSKVISETIKDPDFGLELREKIKKKLDNVKKGKVKFYSLTEVKRKLSSL